MISLNSASRISRGSTPCSSLRLSLGELAAGIGQALRERFGHQAILGRGDAEIDRLLIGLGQEVDAFDANLLRVEVRIETGAQHGAAEAARILVEQVLELLRARDRAPRPASRTSLEKVRSPSTCLRISSVAWRMPWLWQPMQEMPLVTARSS